MTVILQFSTRGTPAPQGSKSRDRFGRSYESSKKVTPWRADVKAAAEAALQEKYAGRDTQAWRLPCLLSAVFYFRRPKSHYRTGRHAELLRDDAPRYVTGHHLGDLDKLLRSTLDALKEADVIADDSLIVGLGDVWKVYADNHPPGARITLTSTDHETVPVDMLSRPLLVP